MLFLWMLIIQVGTMNKHFGAFFFIVKVVNKDGRNNQRVKYKIES